MSRHNQCFNPRARVGRDLPMLAIDEVGRTVSIHAPAWGATYDGLKLIFDYLVSIHAPAWGATKGVQYAVQEKGFQSTRPRGARHMMG